MHCLLCYTAAQHLSVHSRSEGTRETHSHRAVHTSQCAESAKERVRGKKMERERGKERERGGLKNEWPSRTGCIHRQTL